MLALALAKQNLMFGKLYIYFLDNNIPFENRKKILRFIILDLK